MSDDISRNVRIPVLDTLSCPHTQSQDRYCHHLQHPVEATRPDTRDCTKGALAATGSTLHDKSVHTVILPGGLHVRGIRTKQLFVG